MTKKDDIVWLNKGHQHMCLGFCPSRKAWDKMMKRANCREPYPTSAGNASWFEPPPKLKMNPFALVTMEENKEPSSQDIIALLAHEVVHLFEYVCEYMNEKNPGEEFRAHFMQYVLADLIVAYEDTRRPLCLKK